MPFGSRENNLWFITAVVFICISVLLSMLGQVMFNKREIQLTVRQNETLAEEHARILRNQESMMETLKRIEASAMAGKR